MCVVTLINEQLCIKLTKSHEISTTWYWKSYLTFCHVSTLVSACKLRQPLLFSCPAVSRVSFNMRWVPEKHHTTVKQLHYIPYSWKFFECEKFRITTHFKFKKIDASWAADLNGINFFRALIFERLWELWKFNFCGQTFCNYVHRYHKNVGTGMKIYNEITLQIIKSW